MSTRGRYKAAFMLPVPNEKILGDAGWEFQSDKRLPKDTEKFLLDSLKLKFVENYSGMSTYENDAVKATVIFDDVGEIEDVCFKLYGMTKEQLSLHFQTSSLSSCAELFFPSEKHR